MNEHEYITTIHHGYDGTPVRVHVNKVGGGTAGKYYTGELWDAKIYDLSENLLWDASSALYIGGRTSHEEAAYIAMSFFEDDE